MADKGIRRFIRFVLDRPSAKKVGEQMEDVLGTAGKEGGENFARELRNAYNRRMAQLREELASGAIDQKRFKEEADKAARAFNQSMLRSIQKAREEGKLTDREYVKLTRTLKRVGDTGEQTGGRVRRAFTRMRESVVAQLIGVGSIGYALREAVREADLLDASQRTLSATAKITGVEFGFLERTAQGANKQFRLGVPLANNLTIELTKLTSKAGALNQTSAGLEAFLDIGAARGLSAQQTLDAVAQSILGIDEGTDKLFGKNPSVLYAEFAEKIGTTAGKLTDAQKAQALLDAAITDGAKVRGEYQRWLETAAGQQFLLQQGIDESQAALGRALQPAIVAFLPIARELTDWFTSAIEKVQELGARMAMIPPILRMYSAAIRQDAAAFAQAAADLNRVKEVIEEEFGPGPGEGSGHHSGWFAGMNRPPGTGGDPSKGIASGPGGVAVQDPFTVDEWGRRRGVGAGLMPGEGAPAMPSTRGGPWEQLRRRQQEQARAAAVIGRQVTGLPGLDPAPVATAAEQAAEAFEGPWLGALDRIANEVESNGDLFRDLGRAWAEGGLAGLAAFAGAKVKENLAQAIEWAAKAIGFLAFGRADQAAAAGKAAAGHAAAATAWKAVSAGLGGSGGGGSRALGAGSGIGTVAAVSGARAEQANPQAPETHIYIDPLDPNRPAVQKTVYAANQYATERFGRDAKVFIHPRTGN